MGKKTYRIAVDIGGTFTDVVGVDTVTREERTAKISSTPEDYSEAVVAGVDEVLRSDGRLVHFVHGTTAALNSILQRRGARTALVTTRGFRDIYEIARANRTEMYDLFYRRPVPLVRGEDIYEIDERVLADGSVRTPLRESEVVELADTLAKGGYESVAVVLLHSYINPEHERRVGDLLALYLEKAPVSLSHEVANEYREYERTSTTVMNAYVAPVMRAYLSRLEVRLRERGYEGPVYIMRSSGGVMTAEAAKAQPVQTIMSGPVGGAVGCEVLARDLDEPNLIAVDMGGTSFDISLVVDGRVDASSESSLEGFPVLAPMVEIHSLGAGGGSIAHEEEGILRVGPRSSGASPGPASYSLGGEDPTVTDANLLIGRIVSDRFLGGRMTLDSELAYSAMSPLAAQLGYDEYALANGILAVTNAAMANAIRAVTVRRGVDPRSFTLVAFGGAGPLHGVELATELGIPRVVIANSPGTFSAYGMLNTDLRHDGVIPYFVAFDDVDAEELESAYNDLEASASKVLADQGVAQEHLRWERTADVRYVGQEFFVNMAIPSRVTRSTVESLQKAFVEAYLARYKHANPDERAEFVNLRVIGLGELAKAQRPRLQRSESIEPPPGDYASVQFQGKTEQTLVLDREHLRPGMAFSGPALVVESFCTTVVTRYFSCRIDDFGNLVLDRLSPDGQQESQA